MEHGRAAPGGRSWAWDRIQDWLGTTERMLLITGGAGCGKSALVAAIAQHGMERGLTIHATHHCLTRLPSSTEPARVFASLAGQLARRVPGYGAVASGPGLADRGGQAEDAAARAAVLDSLTPRAAHQRALRDPFDILTSTGRLTTDVVIVVDGLDECAPQGSAILTELLAGSADAHVPHLRVIATARPSLITEARSVGPFTGRQSGISSFDLTADSPDVVRDVAEFLAATANHSRTDASALASAAGGSLLYADLATRLDHAGYLGVGRSGQLPDGLDGLYDVIFGATKSYTRHVLGLLARSRGHGLTPRQLTRLCGATAAEVNDVLSSCAAVVVGRRRRRPHHRCLGEYVAATGGPSSAELDWMIAERLLRDGVGCWPTSEEYGLRNVLIHLADVGAGAPDADRRHAAATAIGTTVEEPGYLTAALAHVGVDDLLSGFAYVLDRAPTVALEVGRVAEVLRAQAPALRTAWTSRDHDLAVQQLVYEAATVGGTSLSRALVDRIGVTGILTLWATVNSPTRFAPEARPGHRQQVDGATIMLDGERGVTSSHDGAFRVWQLASGQLAREIDTDGGLTRLHAIFDPRRVVTAEPDSLSEVLNIESGEMAPFVPERTTQLFAVDREGIRGISGDPDGNATIWDLEIGQPMIRLFSRSELLTAVDITADGRLAATGSISGDVIVWDVPTGLALHRLGLPTLVSALALTPGGRRLIIGDDESLAVYAVPGVTHGCPVARLVTRSRVTAIAVNPAMPSYVLCGTDSGQVMYLRIPT